MLALLPPTDCTDIDVTFKVRDFNQNGITKYSFVAGLDDEIASNEETRSSQSSWWSSRCLFHHHKVFHGCQKMIPMGKDPA